MNFLEFIVDWLKKSHYRIRNYLKYAEVCAWRSYSKFRKLYEQFCFDSGIVPCYESVSAPPRPVEKPSAPPPPKPPQRPITVAGSDGSRAKAARGHQAMMSVERILQVIGLAATRSPSVEVTREEEIAFKAAKFALADGNEPFARARVKNWDKFMQWLG